MNRTILRCTNKLTGTTLKEMAQSRKMQVISARKELVMKLYNNKYEYDDEVWCDLANTLNDLQIDKIVTYELKYYWKHHYHAKDFLYEIPLDIYYSYQELYTRDSWIDHA